MKIYFSLALVALFFSSLVDTQFEAPAERFESITESRVEKLEKQEQEKKQQERELAEREYLEHTIATRQPSEEYLEKQKTTEPTTPTGGGISITKTGATVSLPGQTSEAKGSSKPGGITVQRAPETSKTTQPPTITIKQQELADWQKDWNNFTYKGRLGGYLGGTPGELYSTPPAERAAKILKFIQDTPSGFLSSPESGLEALGSVLREAQSALKGAPREAAEYQQITNAVADHVIATIERGNFGATPEVELINLDPAILGKEAKNIFGTTSPITAIVSAAAEQKAIDIVDKAPLAEGAQGVKELNKLVPQLRDILSTASPETKAAADKVIAQKITELIAEQTLPQDSKAAINELLKSYLYLQDKNYVSPADWAKVRQEFVNRLEKLADTPANRSASIAELTALLTKTNFKNPIDAQSTLNVLSSLVSHDVAAVSDKLMTLDTSASNYNKQLQVLEKYLKLTQMDKYKSFFNTAGSALEKNTVQAAKRVLRISEFLDKKQNELHQEQTDRSQNLFSRIKSFLGLNNGPFNIAERDPSFWKNYQEIQAKELFKNAKLTALPEDMVAAGAEQIPALERAAQAGTLSPENKALFEELSKIRALAADPTFRDQIPNAQQFIEQFDKLNTRLNAQVVENINKINIEAQEVIEKTPKENIVELSKLQETLDPLIEQLEKLADSPGFTSEQHLEAVQGQVEAWRDISIVASEFPKALTPQATVPEMQAAFNAVTTGQLTVAQAFDYRNQQTFIARLDTMGKQRDALEIFNKILQQKVTVEGKEYTLSQLDAYARNWIENLEQPPTNIIRALEESGFITTRPGAEGVVNFELTIRGAYLTALAIEGEAVARRVSQLDAYINKNKGKYQAQGPTWQPLSDTPQAQRAAKLASKLKLSEMILDDQIAALRDLYNQAQQDPRRQLIYDALLRLEGEKLAATPSTLNPELLADIQEIISTLNQAAGATSIDAPLEIFTQYQIRQAELPESQRTGLTGSLSEDIMRLNATGDIATALEITPVTLRQEINSLAGEMGSLMGKAANYTALQLQKGLIAARKAAGFITKIGSFVAGIWTYFTVKQAISNGATPLAAYIVPGFGTLADALGFAAGSATGVSLWLLAGQIEPTAADIAELNKQLELKGIAPIETSGEGSYREKAQKWALRFLQTDFQNALDAATSQQKIVEQRIDMFNQQRTALYKALGLPETASFTQVSQAIDKKFNQPQTSGSVVGRAAQALAKKRIQKQLNLVVESAKRMAEAHQKEMTNWANVALRGSIGSAEQNTSVLAETIAKATGALGELWRTLSGKPVPEGEQVNPASFDPLYQALQSFYNQQQADLSALTSAIATKVGQMPSGTTVKPAEAIQVIKDTLTSRTESVRNEYLNGIYALLKEKGYSPTAPPGLIQQT